MQKFSYKILRPLEVKQLNFHGYFHGNYSDITKGYICLCANANQLKKIINKHYLSEPIVICKIDNSHLTKSKLKYEFNKINNDKYPHLYELLDKKAIIKILPIETNINDNENYNKIINNLDKYL